MRKIICLYVYVYYSVTGGWTDLDEVKCRDRYEIKYEKTLMNMSGEKLNIAS